MLPNRQIQTSKELFMEGNSRPIGVFDSGVGGLTVVAKLRMLLPHEDIIYVGDTKRNPYGRERRQKSFSIRGIFCIL